SMRRSFEPGTSWLIAPSAVDCKRLSGVRRSCAALSSTVRIPSVSCSILSSMLLISRASVLISSSASRTGRRCERSPRMIWVATAEIAPAHPEAPAQTEQQGQHDGDNQAAHHEVLDVLPLLHVVSDQHAIAARQWKPPRTHLVLAGFVAERHRHLELN